MSRLEDERRRRAKLKRAREHRAAKLDGRTVLARSIKETAWQQSIVDFARPMRWKVYHTHDSRRSIEGWPDLALFRPPDSIYLECKTEVGVATQEQLAWLETLGACGYLAAIVRPHDWELVKLALTRRASVKTVRGDQGEPWLAKVTDLLTVIAPPIAVPAPDSERKAREARRIFNCNRYRRMP